MTQHSTLAQLTGCLDAYDPAALTVEQAQHIMREFVTPLRTVEMVALRTALDRVLARDIVSGIDVPAHDNSAMDGYALRGADLPLSGTRRLEIVGRALAGRNWTGAVEAGECVRIMTGAVLPPGCDTVLPQELVQDASATHISIGHDAVLPGANRRLKGEDLAQGEPALQAGKRLRPAELGLLASLGIAEVPVQRRVRIAFFSTGDELRSVGEILAPGCVYDSNRYTLFGMLQRLGCEVFDMGVVRDDPESLRAAFLQAAENADAVITSGGVSVGEGDFIKQTMQELGEVTFWSVAVRPGRPMAFGRIHAGAHATGKGAYLFGLPGNPVAVMVSFYLFVRPALLRLMGATEVAPPRMRARALSPLRKKPGRTEYQRGILSMGADGVPEVQISGAQGSGILRSMSQANCMVVLAHDQGEVGAGDMVDVIVFEGLV